MNIQFTVKLYKGVAPLCPCQTWQWWGCSGRRGLASHVTEQSLSIQLSPQNPSSPQMFYPHEAPRCSSGWKVSPSRWGCGCWPPSCPSPGTRRADRGSNVGNQRYRNTLLYCPNEERGTHINQFPLLQVWKVRYLEDMVYCLVQYIWFDMDMRSLDDWKRYRGRNVCGSHLFPLSHHVPQRIFRWEVSQNIWSTTRPTCFCMIVNAVTPPLIHTLNQTFSNTYWWGSSDNQVISLMCRIGWSNMEDKLGDHMTVYCGLLKYNNGTRGQNQNWFRSITLWSMMKG